ncbi:hypothetical protein [Metabacillus schmidteae]|uniref:hypothetical protein n=1 Tax=Metabacillus schmidteae TaxID=2730405 RepID=UPI001589E815|nr:hypothetical protein [Metabacillus schmidteae]
MYGNHDFHLINKALTSTKKSLETEMGSESEAVIQIGQAKEDMIRALSHVTSIDHQLIFETMFDQVKDF